MEWAADGFEYPTDGPLAAKHRLLAEYLASVPLARAQRPWDFDPKEVPTGAALAKLGGAAAVRVVSASIPRIRILDLRIAEFRPSHEIRWATGPLAKVWLPKQLLQRLVRALLRKRLPFGADELKALLEWAADHEDTASDAFPFTGVVKACEDFARHDAVAPLTTSLERFRGCLVKVAQQDRNVQKLLERVESILGIAPTIPIGAGEAWSDRALSDLEALPSEQQAAWGAFLSHCMNATSGKPTKKWTKTTSQHLDVLTHEHVADNLRSWLPLIALPRTQSVETWPKWAVNPNLLIGPRHTDLLKGLVWCTPLLAHADLARCLGEAAAAAYKKLPGFGPRATKIGNACIYALGALRSEAAVGALALLRVRVKSGNARKGIEKALHAVAERTGVDREELEELGIPVFGLEDVGFTSERIGSFTAELRVTERGKAQLSWIKPDGARQKSTPKWVKDHHKDELKALKQSAKNIERMLIAQRARLDAVFLLRKQWSFENFDQRYLSHPLVGTLARRLIWNIAEPGAHAVGAMWVDDGPDDRGLKTNDGTALSPSSKATVTPWHPVDASVEEILAWREHLEARRVVQPFKQAHREVYLLTDAERTARTYSNRFAAHVLKQHQFNALCAERGWRNALRLMVDEEYAPPMKDMRAWDLRVEWWVEGLGEAPGIDTTAAGAFLYLGTDQVRFYRTSAAPNVAHAAGGGYRCRGTDRSENHPVPLEDVPPVVLSETLRDIDLFVGVASVGNNPEWSDGGPNGQFRDYWHAYGFGELSGTAQTRKEALERLIPRLKICDVCSFQDRFLVVRGKLRTYKIHLGSSNILMEPNDQYLCIVPTLPRRNEDDVFLPFEGDQRLSVVLSKAMLLAADDKIKDATILRQIRS